MKDLKNKALGQPENLDIIPEPTHPTKTTRVINKFAVVALVLVAISLGTIMSWSFASTNVLEVKNSPFPARIVQDDTNKTGGVVFLDVDFCKYTEKTGDLRMSYVSKSREVFLPEQRSTDFFTVGCSKNEIPVVIPLNLLRDEYKIKFTISYDINPVKKNITVDFESQPVTVGSRAVE